jgi:hypothetical protein
LLPAIAGVGLVTALLQSRARRSIEEDSLRQKLLVAASVWIMVVSVVPYSVLGYGVTTRVYAVAVFGLIPLFMLAATGFRAVLVKCAFVGAAVLMIVQGSQTFLSNAQMRKELAAADASFYLSLKQVVPDVRHDTIFIFLDRKFSNSGCGPSLEMLYNQYKLRCVYFSSQDPSFLATRYDRFIEASQGGWLRTEYRVIIAFDEAGKPYVVPKLSPQDDLGMFIDWRFETPIETDSITFQTERTAPVSPFYEYLLEYSRATGGN